MSFPSADHGATRRTVRDPRVSRPRAALGHGKAAGSRRRTAALTWAILLWAPACSGGVTDVGPTPGDEALALEPVAEGLAQPTFAGAVPGDARLFIVERRGTIRILEDGGLRSEFFLDLRDRVGAEGSEQGLLSLAFHPDFETNRLFYLNYTDTEGDLRLAEFTARAAEPLVGDLSSESILLEVAQPFSNHNGGRLAFGPDGLLYLSLGDGGGAGDPGGNGQDPTTLLGTILRLDVDGGVPFAVPTDNPFVGSPSGRDEIWAYGLRNPWRFAFDARTLYVADVGQSGWEEVNAVETAQGGLNYGWNVMEGRHCFATDPCDQEGLVRPVVEYSHDLGCSITGGHVYRGSLLPSLVGHYFYGDFCSGRVWSFRLVDGEATEEREWQFPGLGSLASFGLDADGELLVVSLDGTVSRMVPATR